MGFLLVMSLSVLEKGREVDSHLTVSCHTIFECDMTENGK